MLYGRLQSLIFLVNPVACFITGFNQGVQIQENTYNRQS